MHLHLKRPLRLLVPTPKGQNHVGQDVFETSVPPVTHGGQAIGVRLYGKARHKFYLFAIPERYDRDWTGWITPIGEEDVAPMHVDRFTLQRSTRPPDAKSLQDAPRIRARMDSPGNVLRDSRSPLFGVPACS